jgi:hypothetical protein
VSSLLSLSCRAQLNGCPNFTFVTPWHRLRRHHPISPTACETTAVGTCLLSSNSAVVEVWLLCHCTATATIPFFALRSLPSNGSIHHRVPSVRLFNPYSLQQVYYDSFSSKGCACSRSHHPPHGSVLCGVYSPAAPATPSLRLLIPCGSLIGCQPVQVYHHHPDFQIGGGKGSENGQYSYSYIHSSYLLLVVSLEGANHSTMYWYSFFESWQKIRLFASWTPA